MNLDQFNIFRQSVANAGVIFFFNGDLSQTVIAAIGDALRHRLEREDGNRATTRKVFSAFIEMMQNVVNYSDDALCDEAGTALCQGTVAVGRQDGHFFIVCGNPIASEHVERVRARLDLIRAMSLDEIKQLYREKLRSEGESTSKGAGLGFLTVARDASEPIEFSFAPLPGDPGARALFYLKATI